jgi:hypothetical protein
MFGEIGKNVAWGCARSSKSWNPEGLELWQAAASFVGHRMNQTAAKLFCECCKIETARSVTPDHGCSMDPEFLQYKLNETYYWFQKLVKLAWKSSRSGRSQGNVA